MMTGKDWQRNPLAKCFFHLKYPGEFFQWLTEKAFESRARVALFPRGRAEHPASNREAMTTEPSIFQQQNYIKGLDLVKGKLTLNIEECRLSDASLKLLVLYVLKND